MRFVCTILLAVSVGLVVAQTRPGFAGTWRPGTLSSSVQDVTIRQDAATLTIVSPGGGDSRIYKLDGSESRNADEVARVSWRGATLVIDALLGDLKIKSQTILSLDAGGSLVLEVNAGPPLGDGTPTRVVYKKVGATAAGLLPATFTPPPGFVLDAKRSKAFDFSHEPMGYRKGAGTEQIDPEGRTWILGMNITPPNKTGDVTDAVMRAALKEQGWQLYTPSGTLVAHRTDGKTQQWFKGAAFAGDYRATIIEVGPPPHALALPPPAAVPEAISDSDDFPYLQKFPGYTLKRSAQRPDATLDATGPGAKEQLVGPPVMEKIYDMPASMSTYELMVVYRDALTRAGWTVIRSAAGSDALVVAHYAKNGRDLYCYLHDGTFRVADVGAVNDAKRLADSLAKDGHVAIYGIYFDVDKSVLRPDSETALQHILQLLHDSPSLVVEVQGHTDNTGTAARNAPLSDERAASVTKWLVEHGVAASRLTAKGYGDTQPVGDNKTPEGRAKNRRVELKKAG
jgi:outer membrane protein OmpA-like peptidoglycan-associated protein